MREKRRRRWPAVVGLLCAVTLGGCAQALDLGGRAAGAVLESALKAGADGASKSDAPQPQSAPDAPPGETPCRKKQREWRKAQGESREEPPPHLRCGPAGEWPDESEVLHGRPVPGF